MRGLLLLGPPVFKIMERTNGWQTSLRYGSQPCLFSLVRDTRLFFCAPMAAARRGGARRRPRGGRPASHEPPRPPDRTAEPSGRARRSAATRRSAKPLTDGSRPRGRGRQGFHCAQARGGRRLRRWGGGCAPRCSWFTLPGRMTVAKRRTYPLWVPKELRAGGTAGNSQRVCRKGQPSRDTRVAREP